MKQRLDKRMTVNEKEAFNLDIVDCKEAQSARDFLSKGFQDLFKYSFRGLVFFPREKVSLSTADVNISSLYLGAIHYI